MALTLASAADLLKEHHLLREIIKGCLDRRPGPYRFGG